MAKLVPLTGQKLTLALPVSIGDTTINVVGKFKNTITGDGVIGPQIICLSPWASTVEYCYIDVTEEPTEVDSDNGVYQYTLITRGIGSANRTAPPTDYSDDLKSKHDYGDAVIIPISVEYMAQLEDSFDENVANRFVQFFLFEPTTDVTVGDGRSYFVVPSKYDGATVSIANAVVLTAGATGSTTIQVNNTTTAADILSTPITISDTDTTGSGIIDTDQKVVSVGDIIRIDVDTATDTAPLGLIVNIEFVY